MVSPCKTVTALVEAVSRNRFGAAVSWRIATSSGSLAGSLGLISVNIRSYPRQQGAVPVFPEPLTHSMLGSVWGKKKKRILSFRYEGCVLWQQTAASDHRGADPEAGSRCGISSSCWAPLPIRGPQEDSQQISPQIF